MPEWILLDKKFIDEKMQERKKIDYNIHDVNLTLKNEKITTQMFSYNENKLINLNKSLIKLDFDIGNHVASKITPEIFEKLFE